MIDLVRDLTPRLLTLAEALVGDREEAHEVVRLTWVRAFKKRRRLMRSRTPATLVVGMCRREGYRWRKTYDQRKWARSENAGAVNYENVFRGKELLLLAMKLEALPPAERQAVEYCVFRGLTLPDGTVAMGTEAEALEALMADVSSRLLARRQLRGAA